MNGLEMRDATLALNPASLPKRLIRIFVGGIAGRYIELLIVRKSHLGVQYLLRNFYAKFPLHFPANFMVSHFVMRAGRSPDGCEAGTSIARSR